MLILLINNKLSLTSFLEKESGKILLVNFLEAPLLLNKKKNWARLMWQRRRSLSPISTWLKILLMKLKLKKKLLMLLLLMLKLKIKMINLVKMSCNKLLDKMTDAIPYPLRFAIDCLLIYNSYELILLTTWLIFYIYIFVLIITFLIY